MLLALDVGNTHVVVGLMEGREVRRSFRIATRRDNAVGDYAVALSQLLELAEVDRQEVEQVIISSVVPPVTRALQGAARLLTGKEPLVVVTERIQFDIEIDKPLMNLDDKDLDFQVIGVSEKGNSIIRFEVYKNKSTDEDDDSVSKNMVPFQIAYAVSIHKAQGLEYDSVKIIITDDIDELITHSIFYTAITRAREKLKIYWTQSVEKKVLDRIKPKNNHQDISLLKQELLLRK